MNPFWKKVEIMGKEHRRFDRIPGTFPSEYRLAGSGDPWREGRVINLSAGGMRLLSDVPFPEGGLIEVTFTVPTMDKRMELKGRVIWVKSPAAGVVETGIAFEGITGDQEIQLDEVVHFLLSRPTTGHGKG